MIKFEHNVLQVSHQKACWRGNDGVDILKWNYEIKQFVAQWSIPKEEDTPMLGVIKDHMPFWGVVGKGMCCLFVLRF
jgi:hypothetical protein